MIRVTRAGKFFLIWTSVFGLLGIALPTLLMLFRRDLGQAEFWLWPSSIMFTALDTPSHAAQSTVLAIYILAVAENAPLYGVIGVIIWPIALSFESAVAASNLIRQLSSRGAQRRRICGCS